MNGIPSGFDEKTFEQTGGIFSFFTSHMFVRIILLEFTSEDVDDRNFKLG